MFHAEVAEHVGNQKIKPNLYILDQPDFYQLLAIKSGWFKNSSLLTQPSSLITNFTPFSCISASAFSVSPGLASTAAMASLTT